MLQEQVTIHDRELSVVDTQCRIASTKATTEANQQLTAILSQFNRIIFAKKKYPQCKKQWQNHTIVQKMDKFLRSKRRNGI
jgi:hypothetical protein